MIGPGQYDLECTSLLKRLNAQGVALMVVDGPKGSGFSVSIYGPSPAAYDAMVTVLEVTLEEMRKDRDKLFGSGPSSN